jgi:hypothetical protein
LKRTYDEIFFLDTVMQICDVNFCTAPIILIITEIVRIFVIARIIEIVFPFVGKISFGTLAIPWRLEKISF